MTNTVSLPSEPKVISESDNAATFEVEALYPGYGVTVGNSLRRVLYSSLPGSAITQVSIQGVQHEFSTVEHIKEDVLNICLNLKQVKFLMHTDEPQTGTISVSGEKEITAGDIEFPSKQVEVVNTDAPIATITDKKGELDMEVTVETGLGYRSVEGFGDDTRKEMSIGTIPLDAVFTPVARVRYDVENMRVGERTDFDRLVLEIETDGSITPRDAFSRAAEILIEHFRVLSENVAGEEAAKDSEPAKEEKEEVDKSGDASADIRKMKVEELELSGRVESALADNSVRSVGGILQKGKDGLLALDGMGKKSVEEVEKVLKEHGVELE